MTGTGEPATVPAPFSRSMCSDGRRSLIAFFASLVVPTVVWLLLVATPPSGSESAATNVVLFLLGWNTFVVVYVILTMRTFTRAHKAEFEARMAARSAARSSARRRLSPSGDGPTYAVESALVAFLVVLVLPHIDAIRIHDRVLVPVTISILLSCWALPVGEQRPALRSERPRSARPRFPWHAYRRVLRQPVLFHRCRHKLRSDGREYHLPSTNSVIVALLAALLIR